MSVIYCHCDKSLAERCPCDVELIRLREMVGRAACIFAAPGIGPRGKNPQLGDWNWPQLAEEFARVAAAK